MMHIRKNSRMEMEKMGSGKDLYRHFFFHLQPWLCLRVHLHIENPGYAYNNKKKRTFIMRT